MSNAHNSARLARPINLPATAHHRLEKPVTSQRECAADRSLHPAEVIHWAIANANITEIVRKYYGIKFLNSVKVCARSGAVMVFIRAEAGQQEEAVNWKQQRYLSRGWKKGLYLLLVCLLVPGGTIILLGWLFVQSAHFSDELAACPQASFAELMSVNVRRLKLALTNVRLSNNLRGATSRATTRKGLGCPRGFGIT